MAIDGWAVTFGTVTKGLGGDNCAKCNSPPIDSLCTNFVLLYYNDPLMVCGFNVLVKGSSVVFFVVCTRW